MKKALLFTLIVSFAIVMHGQFAEIAGPAKNAKYQRVQSHPDMQMAGAPAVIGQKMFPTAVFGTTFYDTQSYGNVMPRMHEYPDGSLGTTWMYRGETVPPDPDRGAGYNLYDGTNWGEPVNHVGPEERHGWPNYAAWGPNGEIISVYKYIANDGPILFFRRDTKGEGDWIQSQCDGPDGCSIVWHSMITSGANHEYIHLLAFTYDTEYQGQTNALLYYRSSDGGETWEIENFLIDGLGADVYPSIASLSYTWANPVGNTIAFTYGFDEWGGKIFKSNDNGDNWEQIDVYTTGFDPLDPPTDSPRIPCGSGVSSIALDSDGDAHVVFGRMGVIYEGGTWYYYPWTDGLIYWNEGMEPLDTTIISSTTLQYLEEGGNLIGYVLYDGTYTIPEGQPTYQQTICEWPTISIDQNDNMFVTYSALAPDYLSGDGLIYKHVLATASWDGGASWTEPQDLCTDIQFLFSECVYNQAPLEITNTVHVAFQEDFAPGVAEWLGNHEIHENRMFHLAVPKDMFVGISENEQTLNFEMSDLYPNPANGIVSFNLHTQNMANITVNVLNTIGQSVHYEDYGFMNAGSKRLNFNVSDLDAGIYYCTVNVGGQSTSRKLVVY